MLINKELILKGIEQPTANGIAYIGQYNRPTLRTGKGHLPTLERLHVADGASVIRRRPEKLLKSLLGGGDSMFRPGIAETTQKAMVNSSLRLGWNSLRHITATIESIQSPDPLIGISAKQPTLEAPLSRTATRPGPARALRDERQREKVALGPIFGRAKKDPQQRGDGEGHEADRYGPATGRVHIEGAG